MKSFKIFFISFVFALLVAYSHSDKFPEKIKKCKNGDTDCISRTITEIIQKYPKGFPELGMPSIEPLTVERMNIKSSSDNNFNFMLNFSNVTMRGYSKAKNIRSVGFEKDPKNGKFEMHSFYDKIELQGNYVADGQILVFPIKGEGTAKVVIINATVDTLIKPEFISRGGHEYLHFNKTKIKITPGRVETRLENLFNGNKELGESINMVLNSNWKEAWDSLSQSVNHENAKIFNQLCNSIFEKFPYNELFIDN